MAAGRPGSGRLTEEGEVVVSRARRVMNELSDMVADVTALRQEVVGTVRLGEMASPGAAGAPALRRAAGPPPPYPPQRGRGRERPAGAPARLGPPRPGRGHAASERRRGDRGRPVDETWCRGPNEYFLRKRSLSPWSVPPTWNSVPAPAGPAGRIDSASGRPATLRPAMELDGVRIIVSLAFDGDGPAILPATACGATCASSLWCTSRGSPAGGSAPPSAVAACRRRPCGRSSTSWAWWSVTRCPCPRESNRPDLTRLTDGPDPTPPRRQPPAAPGPPATSSRCSYPRAGAAPLDDRDPVRA